MEEIVVPQVAPPGDTAFWSYLDVALFTAAVLPSIAVALLAGRAAAGLLPLGKGFAGLTVQLVWYLLLYLSLAAIFRMRYGRTLLDSLGWRFPFRGAVLCLVAGPFLSVLIVLIGVAIHTPAVKLPLFDEMLANAATKALFAVCAVVIGPFAEELVFRGLLLPLFARGAGWPLAILITGALFGSLHAYEYAWSWRHVLLISTVGCVLGWVRRVTGSLAGSTFLHASYNLTQVVFFLLAPSS